MPVDKRLIQNCIVAFDFTTLFREGLGWDTLREHAIDIEVDGQTYRLQPLAEKQGLKAFRCAPDAEGHVPADRAMRKIDREVTKHAYEHLIVYADTVQQAQVWQWVRREPGKPLTPRYVRFHKGQSGEAAAQQLSLLAVSFEEEEQVDTLEMSRRARKAFDVEKVTRKFYDRFQREHAAFDAFIEGIGVEADRQWYTSLMLNRLMFVYFIQKKGLFDYHTLDRLDGDQDYLRQRLTHVRQQLGNGQFHSFYRSFLLRLFHEGLSQREEQRPTVLKQLLGNVPYLNGGLFDVHQLEQAYPAIAIPDEAFERIFAFFDEYHWHLDERTTRADNEINPDVLGYIFEKYINQKQMGAYYTKEDITGYISKNTIIPYLLESTANLCTVAFTDDGPVWSLLRETPDRYLYDAVKHGCDLPLPLNIEAGIADITQRGEWNRSAPDDVALPTETWREVVARRARYSEVREKLAGGAITCVNDLITYNLDIRQFAQDAITYCEGENLLDAFYRSLEKITILDPTCGSGAFLFAALNILEPLYEACLTRMQQMVDDREKLGRWQASPLPSSHLPATPPKEGRGDACHRPGSPSPLPSQSPRPARAGGYYNRFREILQRVEQHPNHTYFILKSIIINNLYGVDIMEEAVEICKLRLFLKLAAQIESARHIEPLPDIDFNIRAGNTLVGFATYAEAEESVTRKFDFDNTMERIKSKAKDVDFSFKYFREMQTDIKVDSDLMATMKAQVRSQLSELNAILDSYLAAEYGISHNDIKNEQEYELRFAHWRQTHQPFHWFVEFHRIIQEKGGFNVIIGNPPYVEYSKVRKEYTILGYETESCGNLYAFVMERSVKLQIPHGRYGMIVPHSSFCTDRMEPLMKTYMRGCDHLWISTYSIRPSKLFVGVDQRLAIVLTRFGDDPTTLYSTQYHHWREEARPALFDFMEYENVTDIHFCNSIPKMYSTIESAIWKWLSQYKELKENFANHGTQVYFHNAPRYWIRAMTFAPYFWNERDGEQQSSHVKTLTLKTEIDAQVAIAALNSSLFYWWFLLLSNCRDLTMREIERFPLGLDTMNVDYKYALAATSERLMEDYRKHAFRKEAFYKATGKVVYDEFYPKYSKPIIDEIDRVLAKHYGFTDEELDFIINYDIKYRMGRGGDDDEEEV
jgi:hypothetical protein